MTPSPKIKTDKRSLPDGWQWVRISDICEVTGGNSAPQGIINFEGGTMPFVRMKDLGRKHFTDSLHETDDKLTEEAIQKYRMKVFEPGCILFPRSGSVALNHRAILGVRACIVSHVGILQNFSEKIDVQFLYYYLQTYDMTGLSKKTTGVDSISFSDVAKIEIPLPPLDEQKRIAKRLNEELSAVESARKAAEEQLQAAWELPSAYLRDVFESEEAQGWQIIKLGEILSSTKNGLYKPDKFYGQGKRILKMYNIGRLDGTWNLERVDLIDLTDSEYENYRLNTGDILINRVNSRELVGKCAVIDESVDGAVYESKNIRIRLETEQAESDFVAAYINSKKGRDQFESRLKQIVGQATINRSDLDSFEIPLPSLKVQKRLIEDLKAKQENVRNLVASIESQLEEINALPSALLGRAFTGGL